MIVTGLADLCYLILNFFISPIPNYTPPSGIGLGVLAAANFVLPLSELALVMAAVVAFAVASLGYTAVMRVIKLVRGAG